MCAQEIAVADDNSIPDPSPEEIAASTLAGIDAEARLCSETSC
jgi:hypothetical protein